MMGVPPSPPPIRADLLLPNGKISPPWIQWFSQSLGPNVMSALQSVTLTGDIIGSGGPELATVIAQGVVTLANMATIEALTLIGNAQGSETTPQALTPVQVTAMLNLFTVVNQGLVPSSGGGIINFLRADGDWEVPQAAGAAGGDLSGTFPNPTVDGILGKPLLPLAVGSPYYNGTSWGWSTGGGGGGQIDGGNPASTYGATSPIDGGTP